MARSHWISVLQALFVTFLWSTSWVLIKIGLEDIPPLTFAGLRYGLAFLVLLPVALQRGSLRGLQASHWRALLMLGIVMYALTQGSQFLALSYLPAQTTSLVLSFSPALVALLGTVLLREPLDGRQWFGIALYLAGALLFFYPADLPRGQLLGLLIILVGLISNAGAGILGRAVNRGRQLGPLAVTVVSMGVGAVALLGGGIAVQGLPALSLTSWGIVAWLAVVNTAFAFTLWNHTLRTLSAMESSIINNTMLIQIAVLAWIFLGESLGVKEVSGLLLAAVGTLVVQLLARKRMPVVAVGDRGVSS
ncbi:MAG: DMT family transporter [Trueperaceae bacterium]